jgi:protocatechuate 3,4-dioxygenase beta subunit
MKRWWAVLTIAVLASAGAVAIQLWPDGTDSPDDPAAAPTARRTRRELRATRLGDLPLAPPAGALTLGGRVVDDSGPVAGATVAAFARLPMDAHHPLHAPCDCEDGCGATVLTCGCQRAAHALVELAATGALERRPLARAVTDAAGAFQLTGLDEAEYDLWAELDGAFASREAAAAPAADVELRLAPGFTVRGTVELEGGTVPEGTLVTAVSPSFPRALEALTGPEGRFQLPPLPHLDFTAAVEIEGYLGARASILDSDQAEAGLVLRLVPSRTVSGVVLRDGQPVPGAQVWSDDLHSARLVTDERGAFTLSGFRPGDIALRATHAQAQGLAMVAVPLDRDVTGAEIELQPRGVLAGVVRDAQGRPVEGASVGWSVGCDGRSVLTDASGHYLLDDLGEGPVSLTASAEGFVVATGNAMIEEGQTAELDFTLQPGMEIAGTVVDETGQPLSGASLTVLSGRSLAFDRDTATDEGGAFAMDGLPREALVLRAEHDSAVPLELEVHPPRQGMQIVLRRGASLRVRVLDGSGQPVPDATVMAVQLSGEPGRGRAFARDLGGGESELKGLARGEYLIEASLASATRAFTTVRVEARAAQTVEVRLPALGLITGQVVGRAGAPVAGAWVQAISAGPEEDGRPTANVTTEADGRFELKVPMGQRYQLTSSRSRYRDSRPVFAEAGGAPVTLVLEEPATVKGRVLRGGGSPVTLFDVNGQRQRAADGRFEVEVESGDFTLVVSAPDLSHALVSGRAEAGAAVTVPDVVLAEGVQVTVRALDALTGAPLKGASVWLSAGPSPQQETSLLDTSHASRTTRPDGTAELPHARAGAILNVSRQGYEAARVELRGERAVDVRLRPLATLSVQIAAQDGSLVNGWWVMADGPVNRVEQIPPGGTAELTGLEEGEYVVTAWQTPIAFSDQFPRPAPVTPVKVAVPAWGRAEAKMVVRGGARTISVTVGGGDRSWKITPMLIAPGSEPLPEGPDQLLQAAGRLVLPLNPRSRQVEFGGLGPGRYEVLALVETTSGDALYRDPAGVVVSDRDASVHLTIPAGWRPLRR